MKSRIKVLTYNLLFGKALLHLKKILEKESPDIVGLQEVEEKDFLFQKILPSSYNIAISSHSFTKFGKNYHIFTLYKKNSLSLSFFNYLNLPRNFYEKILHLLKKSPLPRSFTTTYFVKNSKQFLHINLHLSPWSTDGAKVKQIRKIFDFVSKTNLPTIITGDFNFPYGRRRLEYLLEQYDLKEATKNLTYTQESKIFKILPIRLKLDYILYRGVNLVKTTRLSKNDSDHYPILAEFEL